MELTIKGHGLDLSDSLRDYAARRLRFSLGGFAAQLKGVEVRVGDVNGPRGGVDILCRIKVVLSGLPSVIVEHQAASLRPALISTLTGAERAVRRTMQRRRVRPTKSAAAARP